MHRVAALPRLRAVPRIPRAAAWGAAVVTVLAACALWLRDAPVVAVRDVQVTGITGPEAPAIRAQLADAARDMTTLHVRMGQLRSVVAAYPVVKRIAVHTHFPHGLRIEVTENTPVAVVVAGGARIPVDGQGRLLRGAVATGLAAIPLAVQPGGDRVVDRNAAREIALLAAAPPPLRARVTKVSTTRDGGLTLELSNGPELRFGAADRLRAKWAAAAAVLADEASAGAAYVDVRYPERPAAGGLEDPATQEDPETVNAATPPVTATTATPVVAAPAATPALTPTGTTP